MSYIDGIECYHVMIFAYLKIILFLFWERWKITTVSWQCHEAHKKIEQNVLFFKFCWLKLTLLSALSICWSVRPLFCPFISPSAGLLVSDSVFWRLQVISSSLILPICFLANFVTMLAYPHTTWITIYQALCFFFCRARCFFVGLCKILRREPGWLCQKNH